MVVIGGAQAVNIGISILRVKVLAMMIGPAGIGLLSIYNSLQSTAATVSGLGMPSSGVRELASAKGEEPQLSRVRMALLGGLLGQGLIAMATIWLLREPLAMMLFDDAARAGDVGLIGVAVLLTLMGSSQTALLQGMRKIADLGRVTVLAALVGTVAGLCAVWLKGEEGLIWFVLIQPLTAIAVTGYFTSRLPRLRREGFSARALWAAWRPMVSLGVVFMLGAVASAGTLLLVRSILVKDMGLATAGLFAASWGISTLYAGFLLTAMSADYYPRLAEVIRERETANRLMNDQAQLALALGGPVLLVLIGLAPWVMSLLYSPEFAPAAEMLQWQTLGNVFKLACWPIGFSFAAAARSRVFFASEVTWNLLFLALLWFGLPLMGLAAAGVAFLAAYLIYFLLLTVVVSRLQGFRWEPISLRLIGLHAVLGAALLALARFAPVAAAVVAAPLAVITGLFGLRIVLQMVGPHGRLAARLAHIYAIIGWPLEKPREP